VKSNAIVFTQKDRTVGIGAGQMSRLDSVRIAVMKAQSTLRGSVLASTPSSRSATAWTRPRRPVSRR